MKRSFWTIVAVSMLALAAPVLFVSAAEPEKSPAPAAPKSPLIGGLIATSALPIPFDRNMVQSEFVYQGAKQDELLSGKSDIRPALAGRVDSKVKTDKLFQPPGTVIVRCEFDPQRTVELLGSSSAASASKQIIAINDDAGNQLLPIGYAWKKSTGDMQIGVDRNDLIATGHDIPFRKMAVGKDQIFVYWQVKKGTHIKSVSVGEKTKIDADLNTAK